MNIRNEHLPLSTSALHEIANLLRTRELGSRNTPGMWPSTTKTCMIIKKTMTDMAGDVDRTIPPEPLPMLTAENLSRSKQHRRTGIFAKLKMTMSCIS